MAEKLRDAGYPQPSQRAQGYYLRYYSGGSLVPEMGFECYYLDSIYAPTATELIPKGCRLSHMTDREGNSVWAVFNDRDEHYGLTENPHNAAALAFMDVPCIKEDAIVEITKQQWVRLSNIFHEHCDGAIQVADFPTIVQIVEQFLSGERPVKIEPEKRNYP